MGLTAGAGGASSGRMGTADEFVRCCVAEVFPADFFSCDVPVVVVARLGLCVEEGFAEVCDLRPD